VKPNMAGIRFSHLWGISLRVSPGRARYFLLLAQEKVPKEKGTRTPRRLTPIPCVPRQTGRRAQLGAMTGSKIPSWLASNRARSFHPGWLRYSARATGFRVTSPNPYAPPSIASRILRSGMLETVGEPPCLSWICKPQARQILRVRRAPEMARSAGQGCEAAL